MNIIIFGSMNMTAMKNDTRTFTYKGVTGTIQYDADTDTYFGQLVLKDSYGLYTYESDTVMDLFQQLKITVDEYLEDKKQSS